MIFEPGKPVIIYSYYDYSGSSPVLQYKTINFPELDTYLDYKLNTLKQDIHESVFTRKKHVIDKGDESEFNITIMNIDSNLYNELIELQYNAQEIWLQMHEDHEVIINGNGVPVLQPVILTKFTPSYTNNLIYIDQLDLTLITKNKYNSLQPTEPVVRDSKVIIKSFGEFLYSTTDLTLKAMDWSIETDLDFSNWEFCKYMKYEWSPAIHQVIDFNGHSITGIKINNEMVVSNTSGFLFTDNIVNNITIKNLNIQFEFINKSGATPAYRSLFAGQLDTCTLENIRVSGIIENESDEPINLFADYIGSGTLNRISIDIQTKGYLKNYNGISDLIDNAKINNISVKGEYGKVKPLDESQSNIFPVFNQMRGTGCFVENVYVDCKINGHSNLSPFGNIISDLDTFKNIYVKCHIINNIPWDDSNVNNIYCFAKDLSKYSVTNAENILLEGSIKNWNDTYDEWRYETNGNLYFKSIPISSTKIFVVPFENQTNDNQCVEMILKEGETYQDLLGSDFVGGKPTGWIWTKGLYAFPTQYDIIKDRLI